MLIQALATGTILYKGKSEGGIYPIYPHKATKLLLRNKLCNSVKLSSSSWHLQHSRLGHPNSQVLRLLLQNNGLSFNNSANFVNSCTHCLHGKMHTLPFPCSRFVANSHFELVHNDLWGPAPLNSINGYKYYVTFVDHFTCLHGYTCSLTSQKCILSLSCSMLWLKHNFLQTLKLLDQMEDVSILLNPLSFFCLQMEFITRFLVLVHPNRMVQQRDSIDT